MKKGINEGYDDIRNKLFELKIKIDLLEKDPNKKQELEQSINKLLIYQNQIKKIEFDSIKREIIYG